MDHATKYYNMTPIKCVNFWRARPEETWRVYCHPFYTCHGSFCGPFPVSYELNCYPHGAQHCFSTVVDVRGWWLYRTNDPQVKGLLGVSKAA